MTAAGSGLGSDWTFVALTYNASNGDLKLYVNGSQTSASVDHNTFSHVGNLVLGTKLVNNEPTEFFEGLIDQVEYRDAVYSAADLAEIGDNSVNGGEIVEFSK